MARVHIDTSEVRALAADMRAIPEQLNRHVRPIVERGANNIKREIRRNFDNSEHFSPVARTVRYEMHETSFGGDGVYEAEIGPMDSNRGGGRLLSDNQRASSEGRDFSSGSTAAPLAHIAIHGTSRGGGGNVPDPILALENEAPRFEKALSDLVEDLLK